MTPSQQQAALEKLAGWKPIIYAEEIGHRHSPPNFLEDLNAIHNVEKVLTQEDQRHRYLETLAEVVMSGKHYAIDAGHAWRVTHATAAQRAEALLKTLGLWRD